MAYVARKYNPLQDEEDLDEEDLENGVPARSSSPPIPSPNLSMAKAPNRQGVGSQLKSYFIGDNQEPQFDESGIQKPSMPKRGTLEGILNIALPALYSMTQGAQGEGLIGGALKGLADQRQRDITGYKLDSDRYQAEAKAAAQRESNQALKDYRDQLLGVRKQDTEKKGEYRKAMGEAAKTRAGADAVRANKPPAQRAMSDRDKYLDIKRRVTRGDTSVDDADISWAENYEKIMNNKSAPKNTKSGSDAEMEELARKLKEKFK